MPASKPETSEKKPHRLCFQFRLQLHKHDAVPALTSHTVINCFYSTVQNSCFLAVNMIIVSFLTVYKSSTYELV
jgi:hypothetical protein